MANSLNMADDQVRHLKSSINLAIWLWTFGVCGITGLTMLGIGVVNGQISMAGVQLWVVVAIWLGASALAGQIAAWGLGRLLSAPAISLRALERIDTEAALHSGTAVRAEVAAGSLSKTFARLGDDLVRMAHERNGRINELTRALENSRTEGEARANFFAGMSHELRTPLNAIIGYAMLLSEDAAETGNSDHAKDLDRILQSGRRLLKLINDILDLSRIDAGTIVVDRSVVDVVALMESVAVGQRDEARRTGARINLSVSQNVRAMLGDSVRLRQCLNTVLAHVLECNPGREIVLEANLAENRPDHIQFRINDESGRLVASVEREPNPQTADAGRPNVVDADSLASIVAGRLAGLMNGVLEAEHRADGTGALTITLPLSSGEDKGLSSVTRNGGNTTAYDNGLGQIEASAENTVDGGVEPRLVLVIDDDEPTIDLLRRWMHKQGYGVISATNGAQGLALARSRRPDLIILDIFMPGQSGYEVLAALKADEVLRHTPVIVASSDDNRRLGLEAGAAEVMVKPLSRDRLSAVLEVIGEQVGGDILVVDDDPNVRDMVKHYARQAGMSVRVAENGAEGLEFARLQTPAAIVLDLMMPHTDGFQMMQALAADTSLSHVPVMVLSQMDISVDEHTRIREAGHVFYPKWKSSPFQIVQNIKMMVAR